MTPLSALFRCDASPDTGGGHVMRCLTLAGALAVRGWHCSFATNREALDLLPALKTSGYPVYSNDSLIPCDWLIVDHYDLEKKYEAKARAWASHVMAIDDLANRSHDADIIVDQTYGRRADDYRSLAPPRCRVLAGSSYSLLRPQFSQFRMQALRRRKELQGRIDHVLVFISSGDPVNLSPRVLMALENIETSMTVTFVLSPHAPGFEVVRQRSAVSRHRIKLIDHAPDMATLMAEADIAIGAGGMASWERCCMGLPTLLIEIADNQMGIAAALSQAEAVRNLGRYEGINDEHITSALNEFLISPALVQKMSENAAAVCDGHGTERVIQEMEAWSI